MGRWLFWGARIHKEPPPQPLEGVVDKSEFVGCSHRRDGTAVWVKNDATGPPVLFTAITQPTIWTLTNQRIYANCPTCFEQIRSGRYRPDRTLEV